MKLTHKNILTCSVVTLVLFFTGMPVSPAEESRSVFKLAERFYNDSLYNIAYGQYQKYLSLKREHDNDPTAYYKSAYCLYKMGNNREAAEGFEEYIRLFPSEANIIDAMFLAGTLRKSLNEYREASDWFYGVWSRFVGTDKGRLALFEAAQCNESDSNTERAVELYTIYVDRFPKTENGKQAALSLTKMCIDRQEYSRAEDLLGETEKRWKGDGPFLVRVLFYRAYLAKKMQKLALAEEKFQAMAASDTRGFPERELAYIEYVDLLTAQKKYVEAQPMFAKLAQIYKEEGKELPVDFVIKWADNGRQGRLYDEAIVQYQVLLDRYQERIDFFQVRYRLAECLVGKNDFPEAIEILRYLEQHDSTGEYGVKAILKVGDLYFSKGLYPSAIATYRRYLQLPNEANKDRILFKIGKIYQEKYGRFESALREFEILLKMYPASQYYQRALFAMAECEEALQEYRSAVRNYEFIFETGGDTALVEKAKQRAGFIRTFLIKDTEKALYHCAEILRKNPEDISRLERILLLAGIYALDLKEYETALELYSSIDSLPAVSDSVHAEIAIKKAYVYTKLKEKAVYNNEKRKAEEAQKNALREYQEIIDRYGTSRYIDEAAYNLMMLTSPEINDYETFISTYPSSIYLAEVYMHCAGYYEKKAGAGDTKFSKKAVQAYSQIIDRLPESAFISPALIGLARNHLALDELDATERTIQLFLDKFPNSPYDAEAYYIQGVVAAKKKDFTRAADIFKQVLYRYPFSGFAERSRYELATAELHTGRTFEALSDFRLYSQNYPGGIYTLPARYGIAKCLFQLDQREEAIGIFNELLDEKLDEEIVADIHYELARVAESDANMSEALKHYNAALAVKSFPRKFDVLRYRGALYFDNRIYDDAASSYNKALEYAVTATDSVEVLTREATAIIMDGRRKKASKQIENIKDTYGSRYPMNIAEIVYYEGLHLIVEKEYDKAINRFKNIIQKFGKSDRVDDAAYQSALALYYQNKTNDALDQYLKFISEYPSSEFVSLTYFKIAMIFHNQNDFVRAAEYFSKVINEKDVDSMTRLRAANNAAVAYQKTSSWLDAARMYTLIINDYPDRIHLSSYHLKCGFCFVQASRNEEALEHFNEANVDPKKEDKPEIIYWIATCYSKMGEHTKAIAEYLKVPYLYSGIGKWGVTAEFEAARLYERQGEYDKAITLYRKIIRSDGEQGRFGKNALARIQQLNTLTGDKNE